MVFHRSLSDSKSFQVSRTLLSILADNNNDELCMVSILPLFSSSPNLFPKSLGTVPSAPTKIDHTVNLVLVIVVIIIILLIWKFFTPALADVFHWRLSDSKSHQVSWTLLRILADLRNAVVAMVSTHPLNSKSFSLRTDPLVTIPDTLVTIGILVP